MWLCGWREVGFQVEDIPFVRAEPAYGPLGLAGRSYPRGSIIPAWSHWNRLVTRHKLPRLAPGVATEAATKDAAEIAMLFPTNFGASHTPAVLRRLSDVAPLML